VIDVDTNNLRSDVCGRRKWLQVGKTLWDKFDISGVLLELVGWVIVILGILFAIWG
jgi:hypothetical protein